MKEFLDPPTSNTYHILLTLVNIKVILKTLSTIFSVTSSQKAYFLVTLQLLPHFLISENTFVDPTISCFWKRLVNLR